MKEIGEQFKEKREEIGITLEEVSSDLNKDIILVENLESGNHKVFKDILELKDMVKIYAKYLGLDDEKLLGDLDDFLFEKTSKISIEDIKERLKEENKKRRGKKSEENGLRRGRIILPSRSITSTSRHSIMGKMSLRPSVNLPEHRM